MLNKLSICIVAYNNYADIKNAISSMEHYTSNDLKRTIFIVDNGVSISDENEVKDFIEFLNQIPNTVYIDTKSNLGFGKGHNYIMNMLNSEYHAIVNPDIIFCEDSFTEIIEWMDNKKDVGMVIPRIFDENGNKQEVCRLELTVFDMFNRMFLKGLFKKRARKHLMSEKDFNKPFKVPFGQGSFLVIRTKLVKELGGFDEHFFMYCEDADLCKRVNEVSKLMYFPDTKIIHKWEKGSSGNLKLFKYHVQSMIYYFNKWGWKIF